MYLNSEYRHVRYGRDVLFRDPDYGRVRVYHGIGHDVTFVNHGRGGRQGAVPGRYAVPRGTSGYGVMTPGGYRQPQSEAGTAGRRVPAPMINPRRADPARPVQRSRPYVLQRPTPQTRTRTAQPYVRSVPQRYTQPQPYVRSVPRNYAQPQPRAYVRSVPRNYVQPQPRAYVRSVPRNYARPQPRPYFRPAPRPSVRSMPQARVRSAPPRASRPARSEPRMAHRRGHGND